MVSTHTIYMKSAFDNYDTIFCTGPHQISEIRKTEKLYNLRKKNLYKDGYRPLEFIIDQEKNNGNSLINKSKKIILLAPSWGPNSILEFCGPSVIDHLLCSDHLVYLRPHPMTLKHSQKLILEIKNTFKRQRKCI